MHALVPYAVAVHAVAATATSAALTPHAAASTTGPALLPGLLTETPELLAVTLQPTVKEAFNQALTAVTTMAAKPEAIRPAEMPVSIAEAARPAAHLAGAGAAARHMAAVVAHPMAAVAAAILTNCSVIQFPADPEIQKWRKALCGERS